MMKTRKSAVLGGIFTAPAVFWRVIMEKKPFLLVLPACLVFCLLLASCDNDYKTESVPGLWEQIRNTVWTMDKTIVEDGKEYTITYTVGFYGPRNGPYASSYGETPYAVIRVSSNDGPEWLQAGHSCLTTFNLTISRTGDTILEFASDSGGGYSTPDAPPSGGSVYVSEGNGPARSSFNISVSSYPYTLTISNAKIGNPVQITDVEWEKWESIQGNNEKVNKLIKINRQINGTYSWATTDPNYDFFEREEQLWSKIRNTAWKKPGDSKPSVGFYEDDKGPKNNDYFGTNYGADGYVFLINPDNGNEEILRFYIKKGSVVGSETYNINKNGDTITSFSASSSPYTRVVFNIAINGNTLTISNIRVEGGGLDESSYIDLEGTYSKYSTDPDYNFDEGRTLLWSQIKNTAWKKPGDSNPSIGFYEEDKGPKKYDTFNDWHLNENEYVFFINPDSGNEEIFYFTIRRNNSDYGGHNYNSNRNGNTITAYNPSGGRTKVFNIAVSGDTLTISNIRQQDGIDGEWDLSSYTVFEGAYSKYSSDPDFNFDEGRKQLWSQIKNTAWTKQGDSSSLVGFYEAGKGPNTNTYGVDKGIEGYFLYIKPYSSNGNILYLYYDISKYNSGYSGYYYYGSDHDLNNHINRNGDTIRTETGGNGSVPVVFNIAVSGNTLTISNAQYFAGGATFTGITDLEGTYTLTSSDPDYSWD